MLLYVAWLTIIFIVASLRRSVVIVIGSVFMYTLSADISVAVVNLLQEMTDVDTLTESEESAEVLTDALVTRECL